jgi:hypothetical protein
VIVDRDLAESGDGRPAAIPPVTTPLVIACGALASELRAVLAADGIDQAVEVRYLPAHFHNRPERIVPALEEALADETGREVLIAYADCGTGGALDRFVDERPNTTRLPGAHCYELFAGPEVFAALQDAEPGTFYLTDYLAKHFDPLVWQGLGLDRHPELRDAYFGNYRRLVLLSQSEDPAVVAAGRAAADQLGLDFEHRHVGRRGLADAVGVVVSRRVA